MVDSQADRRREQEKMPRQALRGWQLDRLNQLLDEILPTNQFYADKLAGLQLPLSSLDQFGSLPLTTKSELVPTEADSARSANHTYPTERYARLHRTSGTHGQPLVIMDTTVDWQWWLDTWQFVLDAVELTPSDRAMMAFSFGPFIGFWTAHEAVLQRGAMSIPSGGLSSEARLRLIDEIGATVIFPTPPYALRLADVASQQQRDLASGSVSRIVVAGEPGGSLPAVRARIEQAWGARVIDHAGATEVGPWGYADPQQTGLHVIESEFIAEFVSVQSGEPAADGELSELILTPLGRSGCPLVRYKTGDRVRPRWTHDSANQFVLLEGGVLGRADDMLVIRGVNIFPGTMEEILRSFSAVGEYRITATREGEMDQLQVELEEPCEIADEVAAELQLRLGLRIDVSTVAADSLPRFEAKAQRFVDQRG